MVNLLAAAALAAAYPAVPSAAQSEPAMFAVRDADTTIYLFGTFHALDGNHNWFDRNVRAAFDQSNELVLETLLPEGPDAAREMKQTIKGPTVTPSASGRSRARASAKVNGRSCRQCEQSRRTNRCATARRIVAAVR